ncbi:MAG: homogentisate 1,2-dioxygenase [Alphaproteobacteria bacterium]
MRKSFIQVAKGRYPRQAHANLNGLKDDEISRLGFDGRSAQLFRRHDPTQVRAAGSLRNRTVMSDKLRPTDMDDPRGQPLLVLHNPDCRIYVSRRREMSPFFERDVNGDLLYFIHKGTGTFETEFGPLRFRPGDYVGIPKSANYRIRPDTQENHFFIVQTNGNMEFPDFGVFGRQAPLDVTLIEIPEPQVLDEPGHGEWEIRVTHGEETSSFFQDFHPCDVEGWKGDLFPFRFNMEDWNPILADGIHLPPPVHMFMQAEGVAMVHFLPRRAESVQGAERVPWYHRNADYDEVTFVHGGRFFGAPMPAGLLMHTPQGLHHGVPEPVREHVRANWTANERVEWMIFAVDVARPMTPTAALTAFDV